ncbi:MAG: NUDIX domain-containing protein [Pseudomonadaceae bacterium]|nr:NUDIX domain-containing protein [Pseudomonadaceae bacterium]
MMGFEGSYVWQLREVWGPKLLVGIGAETIVTNSQGQVLLGMRNDLKQWATFGGHIDPKEDILACALRELHEETGLQPERNNMVPIGFLSAYDKVLNVFPNGHEMQSLALAFTVAFEGEAEAMDGEYDAFAWFDLDKLPENMQTFSKSSIVLYRAWLETKQFQVM